MAVLKWQWNLWVRGENTSPFQDMKGLRCWMHLENVGENVSKEALPFFLCNKEVISLRNHLHIAFLFSVHQGQPPYWTASLLYSLERTTTAAQLHEPLLLRKNHFIVSPLWPPVFLCSQGQPSQPGHHCGRRGLLTEKCCAPLQHTAHTPTLSAEMAALC